MEKEDNKLLEIKSDRLFHDMFNEHEMDTIEWSVMQILNKSYEKIHGNVKVSNIRLTNMSKDDKEKFVDLVVSIDNKKIIIELNNNDEGSYLRNTLYALNTINNSYVESGDYYTNKVQGILINLNWIKSNYKKDYSKEEIIYQYPKRGAEGDYLLKIININLEYYKEKSYNEFEGVDKLSKLLTINNKEELKEFTDKENLLNNYYNKMDRLSRDKEYCRMVWDERIDENLRKADAYFGGKDEGIREGIEQGIEKGIAQNKREMVINMYKNNIDIDVISKISNLTIEEINSYLNLK